MLSKEEREDALELYETAKEELGYLKDIQPRLTELYKSRELEVEITLYFEYLNHNNYVAGFEQVDTSEIREKFKRNKFEVVHHMGYDDVSSLWNYEEEFNYLVSKYEELIEKIKGCLSI